MRHDDRKVLVPGTSAEQGDLERDTAAAVTEIVDVLPVADAEALHQAQSKPKRHRPELRAAVSMILYTSGP